MRGTFGRVAMGVAVTLFGVGMLLDQFGLLPIDFWRLWPLFVIAAGLGMIVNGGACWGADGERDGDAARAPR